MASHDTLVAALEAAAADRSPLLTLHHGVERTESSARDLLEGARRFGALLQEAGVAPGDRVPILLPTSFEFVHGLLGAMLIGAIPAPLATPMTFGGVDRYLHNLAAVVDNAEARCLLTTARMRDAVASDATLAARLTAVIVPEEASPPARGPRLGSIDARDTALIQYTSGTTGRPKGAVISHGALVANAAAIAGGLGVGPDDVGVSWLPLFHDMGLIGVLLTAICHPYPIHLLRPEAFIMKPRRWLELLTQTRGTISVAPNFAYDLCTSRIDPAQLDGVDLGRWRAALNGSEPVQPSTVRRFESRFGPKGFAAEAMLPVYGLAESTLAVTFPEVGRGIEALTIDRDALAPGQPFRPATGDGALETPSLGRPVTGTRIRITHDAAAVGETVVGEVEVAGPSVMDGYFHNEEASARALRDGWLRTGDLGFVNDGRLFLVGRAKEVIIKGGRNYYPHDVERVAAEAEGASGAAAAFARPNEERGTEDLVVVVETRDRTSEGRSRVSKSVRAELLAVIGVKADEIHVIPFGAIPRTTSGKVRRAECRGMLARGELT